MKDDLENTHSPRSRKFAILIFISLLCVGFFVGIRNRSELSNDAKLLEMAIKDSVGQVIASTTSKNTPSPKSTALPSIKEPTKTSGCKINGALPDRECTPGDIFPNATREIVCVPGYTKTVRSVSTAMRRRGYASYGIPYPQERGTYEFDHLIPLALGGSNDMANLFPESGNPKPGFKEKDAVEMYLRQEVCDGKISLDFAQRQIAYDWTVVYDSLSEKQILELKSLWKTWAN